MELRSFLSSIYQRFLSTLPLFVSPVQKTAMKSVCCLTLPKKGYIYSQVMVYCDPALKSSGSGGTLGERAALI